MLQYGWQVYICLYVELFWAKIPQNLTIHLLTSTVLEGFHWEAVWQKEDGDGAGDGEKQSLWLLMINIRVLFKSGWNLWCGHHKCTRSENLATQCTLLQVSFIWMLKISRHWNVANFQNYFTVYPPVLLSVEELIWNYSAHVGFSNLFMVWFDKTPI